MSRAEDVALMLEELKRLKPSDDPEAESSEGSLGADVFRLLRDICNAALTGGKLVDLSEAGVDVDPAVLKVAGQAWMNGRMLIECIRDGMAPAEEACSINN